MRLEDAFSGADGARKIILLLSGALAGMTMLAIILSTKIGDEEIVVRMLPPFPSMEEMTIGGRSMGAAYAENWGLFVATLLGNINSHNAEEVMSILSRLMTRDVYEDTKESISVSLTNMRVQGFELTFRPDQSRYDVNTGILTVTGQLTETPIRGEPVLTRFTYEMEFRIENGIPKITGFRTYEGRPGEEK